VDEKRLGILLFVASLLAMIGYFWWLFLSPQEWTIFNRPLRDWALIVPILIIVYAFLFIIAWIGRTMASTPPPLSALEKSDEDEEKTKKEEK
jgi:flagellar basal body-associated protein FliL